MPLNYSHTKNLRYRWKLSEIDPDWTPATTVNIATYPNLPPGKYALSCFHDLNGNGKLDTNWMGIPNEPYGFSNNARPQFRAPKWAEAAFDWNGAGRVISVRVEEW